MSIGNLASTILPVSVTYAMTRWVLGSFFLPRDYHATVWLSTQRDLSGPIRNKQGRSVDLARA
jgi:hypothetical protein